MGESTWRRGEADGLGLRFEVELGVDVLFYLGEVARSDLEW